MCSTASASQSIAASRLAITPVASASDGDESEDDAEISILIWTPMQMLMKTAVTRGRDR